LIVYSFILPCNILFQAIVSTRAHNKVGCKIDSVQEAGNG
jgi:hypothetical protein